MQFYILLILPLLFFSYYEMMGFNYSFNKQKKVIIVYSFILIVLMGLRFNIGWDYNAYYITIIESFESNIMSRSEYLTEFLIILARSLKMPWLFFLINAAIQVFIMIKVTEYKFTSLLVYLSFPLFFINSLSVIRNFSAILISLYAISFFYKNDIFKFLLFIFIASLFHKSAYFGLLLLLMPNKRMSVFYLYYIFTFMIIGKAFLATIIGALAPSYSVYLQEHSSAEAGVKALYFLVLYLPVFYLTLYQTDSNKKMSDGNNSVKIMNYFIFNIMFFSAFIKFGTLGHRLTLYGTILLVIYFPKTLEIILITLSKSKYSKYKQGFVLLTLTSFFIMYILSVYVARDTLIPYKTILGV